MPGLTAAAARSSPLPAVASPAAAASRRALARALEMTRVCTLSLWLWIGIASEAGERARRRQSTPLCCACRGGACPRWREKTGGSAQVRTPRAGTRGVLATMPPSFVCPVTPSTPLHLVRGAVGSSRPPLALTLAPLPCSSPASAGLLRAYTPASATHPASSLPRVPFAFLTFLRAIHSYINHHHID